MAAASGSERQAAIDAQLLDLRQGWTQIDDHISLPAGALHLPQPWGM